MGTFVTNPSETLPGPKTGTRTVPEGGDPDEYCVSADWNALRGACNDLRDAVLDSNLSVTSTGSTTARSLRARFAESYNVKDYGAVGDGTADDTSAIQAAITASQGNRAHVVFPAGRYRVTGSGLTMTVGTTLVGPSRIGQGAAQIVYTGTGSALTIAPSNGLAGQAYAFVLRDLGFVKISASGGAAITLTHASEGLLDHISIGADSTYRWATGIRMNAAGIIQIDSPYVAYCDIGIDANLGTDEFDECAAVTVCDGDFWQNGAALKLNSALGWDIHGNWFEQQDVGILFDDTPAADHIRAEGVWVHHNTFLFNGGGFSQQLTAKYLNTGTKTAVVDALQLESNRVFYAGSGLTATANPCVFTVSATTGSGTDARAILRDNRVINGGASPGALVSANDASRVRVEYGGGRYINGSYVDLPLFTGSGIFPATYSLDGYNVTSKPMVTASTSTSGAPVNSTPPITLRATYWNGSASANDDAKIEHVISNNSPVYSQIAFSLNGNQRATLDTSGSLSTYGGIGPGTAAGGTQAGRIYQGSGAPNNANGSNGDFYFRTDTPATTNQRLYVKAAGAWTGIL